MQDFIFKSFEEMSDDDYKKIGFKSGLEIHQQIYTQKKLFCRCPAGIYNHQYNAEILRHMRPTLSELGEYDGTALMEFKTKKEIIYQINHDTVCTYEMDDTPPFELNEDALDIAIEIGMNYQSNIVDEIHIARKQYLDGSIPTGFQRTTIVALDGKIPYKNRFINIVQLGLEEDSCREVSDIGHRRVYRTDRLGMPLIETVTGPEMITPTEAAEVGEILRRIVRSTGKVRTGAGAAREDVNVSVSGGTRIEIKGVPSLKKIPLLTYNEAKRQWNLLKLREELRTRGVTEETFKSEIHIITKQLKRTLYQPIKTALNQGMQINCVTLKGFKGILRWETQTDTYFSREISDRLRVIACLTDLPNMIHSDSSGETIATSEWQAIKKSVGAREKDTIVIVWAPAPDIELAAKEVVARALEATIGIPSETRQALRDGTNGFERILPGPDRMYPDTDLPPKRITKERIEKIKNNVVEYYWDKEKWYHDLNIPEDLIKSLAISHYSKLFKKLVKKGLDPKLVSVALIHFPKRLQKKKFNTEKLSDKIFEEIFEIYEAGKISREGILQQLENYLTYPEYKLTDLPAMISKSKMKNITKEVLKEHKVSDIRKKDKAKDYYMGLIMKELRGRIEGYEVAGQIEGSIKEADEK